MDPLSRRTLLRAGAALCAIPFGFESSAQALPASFEGPGPIELGTGATHIHLVRIKPRAVRRAPGRAVLHLHGLVARTAPGVLYDVHLSLQTLSRPVGIIAFAGAPMDRSFDIAALLPRLGDTLVVSVVPHGIADARAVPRIARLSIVET